MLSPLCDVNQIRLILIRLHTVGPAAAPHSPLGNLPSALSSSDLDHTPLRSSPQDCQLNPAASFPRNSWVIHGFIVGWIGVPVCFPCWRF